MGPKYPIGLLVVVLYAVSCSHQGPVVKRPYSNPVETVKAKYDVPVVYNDRVQKWIHHFQYKDHARFSLYLARSGRYIPFMREILRKEGLPQDLVYLALIESGFSNYAYSKAHAVGPWQFIRPTGRIYGLAINSWVDERRDPEKATRAAARYLKKLYGDFGDWYLAMAAYNAGEGRIKRATHQARSGSFWQIAAPRKHYLRNETKEYVPKFLAAMIIAKNPQAHGFSHVRYEEPLAFERVTVRGPLGLDVAAELAGVPVNEIRLLNPELALEMTPQGVYSLKIPAGTQEVFHLAYAQLPPEEKVRVVYHTIRSGDSIWKIARRYGVSKDSLMAANNLTARSARYLRPGKRLIVPKRGYVAASAERTQKDLLAYNTVPPAPQKKRLDGVEYMIRKDFKENGEGEELGEDQGLGTTDYGLGTTDRGQEEKDHGLGTTDRGLGTEDRGQKREEQKYVVKRGDSLWQIARQHRVAVSDLKAWNDLQNNKIRPGRTLMISPIRSAQAAEPEPVKKEHIVRQGENLWRIARQHGVTLSDLREWNNLPTSRIHPGKSLVVSAP
ncbi:MAG: LysM peptidoglycan-binding domain-containing protein [Deltaproteobacteria bacterium]|nr:LysM peptidoglycan-binding domain-containing protein [Deltaproteobacteria bacterium]